MTTEEQAEELHNLRAALQENRLIEVYVAENPTPYLVQQTILESISDYFVRAFRNEDSLGGEQGVLRFPEDDETTWELLLYWKLHNKVLRISDDPDEMAELYVRCWILGDRYNIKEFQDVVMLELLLLMQTLYVKIETIKLAFEGTPEYCALRKLMARETVYNITEGELKRDDLEALNGIPGVISELVEAYGFRDSSEAGLSALCVSVERDSGEWQEFMLQGGPSQHWIHTDDEEDADFVVS